MAASNETRLLSKAIRNRDIAPLLVKGCTEDWFVEPDDKALWRFLLDHWNKYQEVPTAVTVKDNYPNYRLLAVEDTIDYLVDQLVEWRKRHAIIDLIQEATDLVNEDEPMSHESALAAIQRGLVEVEKTSNSTNDLNLMDNPKQRLAEYYERKNLPNGLRGIPTGFDMIDKATSGLQAGQLVTVIAPPKTGKSTLALQMALNLHKAGNIPLFQSFEMSNEEQQTRYDCMFAHINHGKFMNGTLERGEERAYEMALEEMEEMGGRPFWLADAVNAMTVSSLAAKIQIMQPEIVFIDGVYLMMDEISGEANSPQAITNITRSLKRLAQKIQKPIVISTQVLTWKMKGRKVSADSIGYSSSFYQDSDVIIALERPDEDDDTTRMLRIVASRNCGPGQVMMNWDWNTGQFSEMEGGLEDEYD